MPHIVVVYDGTSAEESEAVRAVAEKAKGLACERFGPNGYILYSNNMAMQAIEKMKAAVSSGRLLWVSAEDGELRRCP